MVSFVISATLNLQANPYLCIADAWPAAIICKTGYFFAVNSVKHHLVASTIHWRNLRTQTSTEAKQTDFQPVWHSTATRRWANRLTINSSNNDTDRRARYSAKSSEHVFQTVRRHLLTTLQQERRPQMAGRVSIAVLEYVVILRSQIAISFAIPGLRHL